MIHSVWEAFVSRLWRNADADEEDGKSRFVPSPLDVSVRVAHGGHDVGVERELSRISERAAQIDEDERGD